MKRDFHAHIWPEHWRRIRDRYLHLNRIFLKAGPRQNANNTSFVGFAGRGIQGNIDMLSDADSASVALRYINPGLDLRRIVNASRARRRLSQNPVQQIPLRS